jgi:signal peptidase II
MKRFRMNPQIKSNWYSVFLILSYSLIILLLDQVSKIYVVHILDLSNKLSIVAIPGFFNLKMAWNEGINFGLFASGSYSIRIILISISSIICLVLFLWSIKQKSHRVYLFAAAIIGGAFGNVLDRIVYGAVADFLNFTCCGIQNPYSFNVADIAIFLGAAGLILYPNSFKDEKDLHS